MDAQKVIEVANLYLGQYGHHLTDEFRAEVKEALEADEPLPTTQDALLQFVTSYENDLRGEGVIAKHFSRDGRWPTVEDAIAHCAAMNRQMAGFLADGKLEKCCQWWGFIAGVECALELSFDFPRVLVPYAAEEAGRYAIEGKLLEAFSFLGFAQGILFAIGAYSIEELKNHNKPLLRLFPE